ncbi:hypothetical protein MPLB_1790009 [Mesorhizobium sp. ORS 3324]|nr:hypothetical protein MPLB_1790009 [Mesorhizobium sp. ORS 3324]
MSRRPSETPHGSLRPRASPSILCNGAGGKAVRSRGPGGGGRNLARARALTESQVTGTTAQALGRRLARRPCAPREASPSPSPSLDSPP